jgi:hypothetical protein
VRNVHHRVTALEARRAEQARMHTEVTMQVYDQIAGTFFGMFERILDRLEATPAQRAHGHELLEAELRRIVAGGPDAA